MDNFEDKIANEVLELVGKFANELYERFADSVKIEEIKFNEGLTIRVGNKDFVLENFYTSTGDSIKISGKKKK